MEEKKTAYLGLGANLGDREANVRRAIEMLDEDASCEIDAVSSLYLTKPVGVLDQPDFVNAVACVKTDLSPLDLLRLCKEIERRIGRMRTIRWGPRVIDIDILLYGDEAVDEGDLAIPHPRMMERAFVLVPLSEIAPDLVLPGGLTASQAARNVGQDGIRKSLSSSGVAIRKSPPRK